VTHQLSFIVHEEIRVSMLWKNVMVTITATTRRMKQSAVSSHISVFLTAGLGSRSHLAIFQKCVNIIVPNFAHLLDGPSYS